jgi:hypothetical protein
MSQELGSRKPWFAGFLPLLLLLIALSCGAAGQAWVPEKGEGAFTTSYNYIAFNGHFSDKGTREPEASSRAQSVIFNVEYGITDKLALTFAVPIVSDRYASTNPPSDVLRGLFNQAVQTIGPGVYKHDFVDDGSYHPTIQDLSFEVRYKVLAHPFVLTPFVGFVTPSHDYAYVGESAPGRNLKQFQFGTNIARRLNPFLRNAYIESGIAYTIPEEALGFRTNRLNTNLEFGYSVNRKLAVRGFVDYQHTFNGIASLADLTTPLLELTHERLLKAEYWHLGGGFSYSITPKTDISADVITYLAGKVTHYGTGVSVRVTRSFRWDFRKLTGR